MFVMSDTEQDSISTMTQTEIEFEDILTALEDCATDTLESKDYISFSALMDLYLNDLTVYTDDEKIQLLHKLYDIFAENYELVYEIGWDLPEIVFRFLDAEWQPAVLKLREQNQIVLSMKIFDVIAALGNPKELLLTCCELLRNLRKGEAFDEEFIQSIDEPLHFFYDLLPLKTFTVKFHCLTQLLVACLARNKTIYPSKFLSKVSTAMIDFMKASKGDATLAPITRRLYTFIRDYIPPDIPEDNFEDPKDLRKIFDDENYLQRKLLVMLLTVVIESATMIGTAPFLETVVPSLIQRPTGYLMKDEMDVLCRLSSLALSMDLDVDSMLKQQIVEAGLLFKDKEINSGDDILKYVINDYNKTLQEEKKHIPMSSKAIVILYTVAKYLSQESFRNDSFEILDMISFQVKTFVPFMIQQNNVHYFTVASCMVITLNVIDNTSPAKLGQVLDDPRNTVLIMTYLQNLTSLVFSSHIDQLVSIYYVLVTRLLISMNEDLGYQFLKDSIYHCPFEESKPSFIGILKDFILRKKVKPAQSIPSTAGVPNGVAPPQLPPRTIKPCTYITLTDERGDDLLNLFSQIINETFVDAGSDGKHPETANLENVGKLLSMMNLINSVNISNKSEVLSHFQRLEKSVEKSKPRSNGKEASAVEEKELKKVDCQEEEDGVTTKKVPTKVQQQQQNQNSDHSQADDDEVDAELSNLFSLITFGIEKGKKIYTI
ncbi:unnamed protein product [Ambrosiozyma monospora]|uniref:Unnamed protein product n=1 Tax=Ambrosiozyma monospora TaxID=43982 RepID=A0A9W6YPM8_AMBMO|nr:unnamed protein product [Ambrosiozyma monospora]